MNNRDLDTAKQHEREFEELLCLAYLFTHSSDVVDLEEYEDPLVENLEFFSTPFVN